MKRTEANNKLPRRFVSQRAIAELSGRSERTLEKDRLFNRGPYPYYRSGSKILYDLDECIAIIEATRTIPEVA